MNNYRGKQQESCNTQVLQDSAACRKTFDTLTGCPKRREIGRMEPEGVYEYSEGCLRAKQAENPLKLD
ncbi:MAG: hypothetical protein IJP38_01065, partial [Oscillospiraceae bacterium]|nr:hypothetical protein [Oscillospiraceae bacterium]